MDRYLLQLSTARLRHIEEDVGRKAKPTRRGESLL
jgi:hypothetical protein